ncbi:MAG TPA: VanZ family protein [Epulopiscium sp.]|nr:VanZ family protein [Candidatus Epulonipiscium sp.]
MAKNKKVFPWLLAISWMALIFYLSHQPAAQSSNLSSGLTELIMNIINKIAPDLSLGFESFHHFVRKNAHFFAYLVLGVLVANATRGYKGKGIMVALLICVLYAISDELHQLFIPGRSGQVMDVVIDSAGSVVGVLSYQITYFFKNT